MTGNSATYQGGGIFNSGGAATLTLSNSTLSGNGANLGGGIFSNSGTVTISNSTFTSNGAHDAGGINNNGTLTISDSKFSSNSAVAAAGAIANSGTLAISNSTIGGNSAGGLGGGGIYNSGRLTVSNSTLSGNSAGWRGGGIYNSGATLMVSNSTLRGNSATNGLTLGSFAGVGGGIYNDGTLTLSNSTLSGNSAIDGGGIMSLGSIPASARSNIIAQNNAPSVAPDVSGAFTSQGHNLIGNVGNASGFTATGDQVGTSASPIDPKLGPLRDNGGPTQTMALLAGSPAIDAGDDSVIGPPLNLTTDQRGQPRKQGAHVDIGAFEAAERIADLIGYRPVNDYFYYPSFPIPEDSEESYTLGPGIRIDGDDDNGNGVPDYLDQGPTTVADNDLIRVSIPVAVHASPISLASFAVVEYSLAS